MFRVYCIFLLNMDEDFFEPYDKMRCNGKSINLIK